MIRANIYNLEPLDKKTRESVNTGIEMVAAFMGHTVVSQECRLRISTDVLGRVDPRRVGFGKMDRLVELHLLAVPLSPILHKDLVGLAGAGRGWAFVDVAPPTTNQQASIRSTTAHEVAHALGYVRPGAHQEDPADYGHCSDPDCILHKNIIGVPAGDRRHPGERFLIRAKRTAKAVMGDLGLAPQSTRVGYQYDFCLPCKVDFREHGDEHLSSIRANRVIYNHSIQ